MYVKPSIRFRGGHVMGRAVDNPQKPARTLLALMVKSLFGGGSFVARLIPVHKLNAKFLRKQVEDLTGLIHTHGGNVVGLISDNHCINRQVYSLWRLPEADYLAQLETMPYPVVLLYDTVHLLKDIRNNWITEAHQEFEFIPPEKSTSVVGQWCDIVSLYQEDNSTVRTTKLSHRACFPSPVERQKVSLVVDVVNDKTVTALELRNMFDTACVLRHLLRMWKIINAKNPTSDTRLNDPDRGAIYAIVDSRTVYLMKLVESFSAMKCGRGAKRSRSLTSDTRQALCQTLHGLLVLLNKLLSSGCLYVLLGEFQSDVIEGEFGAMRQMSGGCYFVSVEQVLSSARLRRMVYYHKFHGLDFSPHNAADCCESEFTEEEFIAMDGCMELVDGLSENERMALLYIAGYVAHKEGLATESDVPAGIPLEDCEFTTLLSRGLLEYPPGWLFSFTLLTFSCFQSLTPSCANHIARIFAYIFDCHFVHYEAVTDSVCRRLANCYLKGLVTQSADVHSVAIPSAGKDSRVLKKLSSSC